LAASLKHINHEISQLSLNIHMNDNNAFLLNLNPLTTFNSFWQMQAAVAANDTLYSITL